MPRQSKGWERASATKRPTNPNTAAIAVNQISIASLEPKFVDTVAPAVQTRPTTLPFHELSWEMFEYAALRLAQLSGGIEHAARLGRSGQRQHGIDLFVFGSDGQYRSWQTKRWKAFGAKQVCEAVDIFRSGKWYDRSAEFVLCVSCDLKDVAVQEEVERQRLLLAQAGKRFLVKDRQQLSEDCRNAPLVVDDLFGREWVSAFLGSEASASLASRLRPKDAHSARQFLLQEYLARFRTLDASAQLIETDSFHTDFRSRIIRPDVSLMSIEQKSAAQPSRSWEGPAKWEDDQARRGIDDQMEGWNPKEVDAEKHAPHVTQVDADEFLFSSERMLFIGDAGFGKSTLLRCLALDLLADPKVFPRTRDRVGGAIPVLIPFSFWVRQTEARGSAVSLEDIVKLFFAGSLSEGDATVGVLVRVLRDERFVLLLDGLDEFSNSAAARTTLHVIETTVGRSQIKVLATTRPSAVKHLGGCGSWTQVSILELSNRQQRLVARQWLRDFQDADAADTVSADRWVDRFFDQLGRTGNLSRIAGAPLILAGCLVVALKRGGTLPRDRFGVFEALLDILVRVQPSRRELEALETSPRRIFSDEALPLECLSRLAFAMMEQDAAGLSRSHARRVLVEYLTSDDVSWSLDRAQAGADDLVGVSADTTGLLAERGPDEIGFLHVSLRDHAAGRHLSSKPFSELLTFIYQHAHMTKWHQVILSAVHAMIRPAEMAKALEMIHKAALSTPALLLAAKAVGYFGHRSPLIAQKIVDRVVREIEQGSNFADRLLFLEALLEAKPDGPVFRNLQELLPSWIPSSTAYRSDYFSALADWPPNPALLETLLSGMEDDQSTHRLAASVALGRAFGHDDATRHLVLQRMEGADGAGGYAALLLALSYGWPGYAGLRSLIDAALSAPDPQIESAAAIALFRTGSRSNQLRDRLINLVANHEAPYGYRHALVECIVEGWRNDPQVRKVAIGRLAGGGFDQMDYDLAEAIFFGSDSFDADELPHLTEIMSQDHFAIRAVRSQLQNLTRLASGNPQIRALLNQMFEVDKPPSEHEAARLAIIVRSEEALDCVLKHLTAAHRFIFWPVYALIEAWGMRHPRVQAALKPLLDRPAQERGDYAEYIPEIADDRSLAKRLLLETLAEDGVERLDFVVRGLGKVTDHTDAEVVEALLAHIPGQKSIGDGVADLLRSFGQSARVCDFALEMIGGREPPLGYIAKYCGHDVRIRTALLRNCRPLPAVLRSTIATHVSDHVPSSPFAWLAEQYDRESDTDTRIKLALSRADFAIGDPDAAEQLGGEFTSLLHVVGHDYETRRLTGFVGLIALGQLCRLTRAFPDAKQFNSRIRIFSSHVGSDAAFSFLADHWPSITSELGSEWKERLEFNDQDSYYWNFLAPHAWRSENLLDEMIQYCRKDDAFLTAAMLGAVARARPASGLLRSVCEKVLVLEKASNNIGPFDRESARFQAIILLVDQFRDDAAVRAAVQTLVGEKAKYRDLYLALVGGRDAELRSRYDELRGSQIDSWVQFLAVGSGARDDDWLRYLTTYLEQRNGSHWGFPSVSRRLITERLARAPGMAPDLLQLIAGCASPNIIVGLAEAYELAWGVDNDLQASCTRKLTEAQSASPFPVFARSLRTAKVRPMRRLLSELLSND